MNIVSSAVFLTVADPAASSRFFTTHLGFREVLIGEEFVMLGRDDAAVELVLVRHDPETHPPSFGPTGVTVSFAVTGIATEYERLLEEGATISVPLHQEPWGELVAQLVDPNGVLVQLTEWVPPTGA